MAPVPHYKARIQSQSCCIVANYQSASLQISIATSNHYKLLVLSVLSAHDHHFDLLVNMELYIITKIDIIKDFVP